MNELPLTIRPMTAGDWPDVLQIYAEGIRSGTATFESTLPDYAHWDAAHVTACRLIAMRGGSLAGWAALSPVSTRPVYRGVAEVSLYVGEHHRHQGVGTALMHALIAASEQAGFWTLQSVICAENRASIALQAACGFRMVGRREKIGQDVNGQWHDTVLMERRSQISQAKIEDLCL